jgi:hypothetical protein
MSAVPLISDVNLLGNSEGVVYLNAQVPNGALNLSVTKKQLNCSQITSAPIDQRCFGSTKRMRAEDVWVQTNASDPLGYQPSIVSLSCSDQDRTDHQT